MQGAHIIFDLYQANAEILARKELLEEALRASLDSDQLELEISSFYQFEPHGVTALVSSPELHFNIHTWPEHNSCAIDLYCKCGRERALELCQSIQKHLGASEYEMKILRRKNSAPLFLGDLKKKSPLLPSC